MLVGVLAGIVLAMSGAETWFSFADDSDSSTLVGITYTDNWGVGVVSSANALALVGLACWGVLLVSRGRFRRVIAVLGLVTALVQLYVVGYSYGTLPDDVREQVETLSPGADVPELGFTGWFWLAVAAAVLSLGAWAVTARHVGSWPEMGRRYDSPADSPPEDLWKAMDQGHDPTS